MAGLLSLSLNSASDVYFEQQAQSYGEDIINRLMANTDAANSGAYGDAIPTAEPSPDCEAEACDAAQMAASDLWQWSTALTTARGVPPGVAGTVTWNAAKEEYQVTVTWDAADAGAGYTAPTCTSADNSSAGCYFAAYRLR